MKRVYTKISDIFSAAINENSKKYFQYVANDLTQLNSDLIRVFKRVYLKKEAPNLSEVVRGEVEFYAHCVTKWGVKLGYWEKVGSLAEVGIVDVFFRSSADDGNPQVKVSHNWWIWKINEEQKYVGTLEGDNQKAEVGSVICAVHRDRFNSCQYKSSR